MGGVAGEWLEVCSGVVAGAVCGCREREKGATKQHSIWTAKLKANVLLPHGSGPRAFARTADRSQAKARSTAAAEPGIVEQDGATRACAGVGWRQWSTAGGAALGGGTGRERAGGTARLLGNGERCSERQRGAAAQLLDALAKALGEQHNDGGHCAGHQRELGAGQRQNQQGASGLHHRPNAASRGLHRGLYLVKRCGREGRGVRVAKGARAGPQQ